MAHAHVPANSHDSIFFNNHPPRLLFALAGIPSAPASPPPAQSLASCQERLLWARNWLFEGRASPPEEAAITKDWLYRFSEELCLPQFRLFRPVQGRPSFAPAQDAAYII